MAIKDIDMDVKVDLESIIDNDLEGLLDLLEGLVNAKCKTGCGVLSDIGYKAVGVDKGAIVIHVTGELDDLKDEEE